MRWRNGVYFTIILIMMMRSIFTKHADVLYIVTVKLVAMVTDYIVAGMR